MTDYTLGTGVRMIPVPPRFSRTIAKRCAHSRYTALTSLFGCWMYLSTGWITS